ncbi:Riboflavin kinase [Fusarium sp. LHS14.1]|nr:Riboflavin kinase [Fusarium sp. LHS14.1]
MYSRSATDMDNWSDPSIRRKPAPAPPPYSAYDSGSLAPPGPPPRPLRPVRSATNLTGAHAPQQSGLADPRGNLPVDFVVDELPRPSSSLGPRPTNEIRRIKSSSALSTITTDSSKPKDQSKWKAALGEAQYFAGGLISHPAESTKHFTIIRHSHALVWYRGPATSVPITIFSDEPLPQGRTVWLQQKGFSGNMGMTLKALVGTNGSWIDVTPASKAGVENLAEAEERGIQRDFKRFFKKASGRLKKHIPRETHVIRIPAAATDGYFRLVLCAGEGGKKVLCGSPVFRIASTSTDASVVRGSSLSTMPLEMGIKVASTIGQQVAKKYTGVAGAVVEAGSKKFTPNAAIKKAAHAAYHTSGIGNAVNESWRNGKAGRYDPMVGGAALTGPLTIIGSDEGPEAPFPFKLAGKVVHGTGLSTRELGIPTANLTEVPDEVKMRMGGVFAAWARLVPNKGMEDIDDDWYAAIVTIAPLRNGPPGVVQRNKVSVHFIHDFEEVTFFEIRVKVMLMGFLHPWIPGQQDGEIVEEHGRDVMTTMASLARETWGPEIAASSIRALRSERSFGDRLNEATSRVQHQIDRIPTHLVGVRSEAGAMRDQVYGNGGMWIQR